MSRRLARRSVRITGEPASQLGVLPYYIPCDVKYLNEDAAWIPLVGACGAVPTDEARLTTRA
jgi:hypothetical protein